MIKIYSTIWLLLDMYKQGQRETAISYHVPTNFMFMYLPLYMCR